MIKVLWDNWGLPTDENGETYETPAYLSIYFTELFLLKTRLDKEFKTTYPQRKKQENESFEEYDDYLTNHLTSYRSFLDKKNLPFLMEADMHFFNKLTSLMKGNGDIIIHPKDYPTTLVNDENKLALITTASLYNQTSLFSNISYSFIYQTVKTDRKNVALNYLSDLAMFINLLLAPSPNSQLGYYIQSINKPTWFSKIGIKYITLVKMYGNFSQENIEAYFGKNKT